MGDKFTITVNTGELSAAETLLGELATSIDEEGGKLGALPGKAASWTGSTATTLKAEMTRISGQMTKSSPHFTTAKTAVGTFRGKLEDAQTVTLPDLNRRWNDTVTAYDSAVGSANNAYGADMRPYRNMPREDTDSVQTELRGKRDKAISDAAGVRDAAQRKLQGEFDQLLTDLRAAAKTCGSALNGAVLAAVPAEIVNKYLAGGGMGPGVLDRDFDKATAGTRQALTGDDSVTGRADDFRAGEELAAGLPLKPGQQLTPEQLAMLKANAGNPAFVEGLLGKLGPSGAAALAYNTRILFDSQDANARKQGQEQLGALSQVFQTGSNIKVDDGTGHERYLMDDGWLANFNPLKAWGDIPKPGGWVDGYRPDLLLPFMQQKGFSANFVDIVSERAMDTYDAHRKNPNDPEAFRQWMLYRGAPEALGQGVSDHNVRTGNKDNPFRTDMWHIMFERVAEHPDVSNKVMMGHFDSMMYIFTGKDATLTGGPGSHNWLGSGDPKKPGGVLGDILKQATLGLPPADQPLADSLLSRMGYYLDKNPKDKFITDVLPALADIVTDDKYLTGQVHSVASPFAPDYKGYDPITGGVRDPRFGLLMPREVWAALQQEAMRRPEGVYQVVGATETWMEKYRKEQFGNPAAGNDATVNTLDYFEYESVRKFLANNVDAVKDDIEADLAKRLEGNEKSREIAKALTGKVFEFVTTPGPPPQKLAEGATAAVGSLLTWGIDHYYNQEAKDITKSYDAQLKGLRDIVGGETLSPTPWGDFEGHGKHLAFIYGKDGYLPEPVTTNAYPGGPVKEFTGDPTQYVGKKSESHYTGTGGNPVVTITDDFLVYEGEGPNKKPVGVVPVQQMNPLQRAAYWEWMHDPATQRYLESTQSTQEGGRDRADQQAGGN